MMKGIKRSGDELLLSEKSCKCPKVEHNEDMIKSSFGNYLIKHNIVFETLSISYGKIDNFLKDLTSNWSVKLSDKELDFLMSLELNKVLQHISFRQYFRHNLEVYCNFVTLVLSKINSSKLVALFLKNELVFYKTFICEKEFRKYFLKNIFPVLVDILCKYEDQELYLEVCEIFKKVILDKNLVEFQNYLEYSLKLTESKTDDKFEIPKAVLRTIGGSFNSHSESYSAPIIIFQSIVDSFKDFRIVYIFSIVMIELLGFNLGRDFSNKKISKFSSSDIKLSKSLKLLLEMLKILKNSKVDLNCSVMITFSQFVENIVNSVLNLTISPNRDSYEVLEFSIDIHPLLVEKHLNNLIAYSMFADNSENEENYSRLLLKIFETYAKLHRIQNLISKMLPVLKSIEDNKNFEEYYTFRGCHDLQGIIKRNLNADKVLPDEVMRYFSQCAMQMASWQYMNLFKTFIFHLDKTVEGFVETNEDDHNSFIEVLCKFTSWLLRIDRMDENTTTTKIMENFNTSMGEVKGILNKLGGALLGREHDQSLVRVFLNLSHDWAESFIKFHYYNSGYLQDEEIFFDVNHTNYLFSFLTHEQWILLSQRIMNFGESNCKYLMLILIIQKLRAMHLFGHKIDENSQREAIDQITSNVEGAYEYIISDIFINEHLLHKLDLDVIMNICDQLLIRVDDTPKILNDISDSQILSNALGFVILKKIKKVLSKAKSSSLLKKLLSVVDKEICIPNSEEDESYFSVLKEVYEQNLWTLDEVSMNQEYEDKIRFHFNYLMQLPIPFLSPKIKSLILVGLFSLHKNFWGIESEFKCVLETCIKNLIREVKIDLMKLFEPKSLIRNLTTNFSEKEEFIGALSENCLKNENSIKGLVPVVDYLLENVNDSENLQYSLLILKDLKKVKKSKSSIEFKEFCSEVRNNILKANFEIITSKKANESMIPSYACCLKHWIVLEKEEELEKLVKKLDKYLSLILDMEKDILPRGSASLFCTVLPNKHIFKVSPELPLKIWTYCKMKKVDPSEEQDFSQLLCLIFEHMPNDLFDLISSDLFSMMVESIHQKNYSQLFKHLQTVTFLLTSSLNPIKIEIWQKILEKLLLQLQSLKEDIIYDQKMFEEIMKFEVAIINRKTLVLSPCMMSMFLMSPYTLLKKGSDFYQDFNICTNYLECLLKHRSSMIMDRLPTYLKVFRSFLSTLCRRCGEAEKNNDLSELEDLADCAYQLEKLVRLLVIHKKDMARIACHLIGDILHQYETFTLYPKVKVHLNNCMYSLISICDNHAVSYLLRVLSSASTELFKKVFDDFKRFHRFTGKV